MADRAFEDVVVRVLAGCEQLRLDCRGATVPRLPVHKPDPNFYNMDERRALKALALRDAVRPPTGLLAG